MLSLKLSDKQDTVWSLLVRVTHWLVAAIITTEWLNDTGCWHRFIGYVCICLIVIRIVHGLKSQRKTSQFYWPNWLLIKQHLQALVTGEVGVHEGHNPLGQLAVYCMWLLILSLAFTGWLSRTDAYWGESGPAEAHQMLSYALMYLVFLHVLAVFLMSVLSGRFLLKQMITGRKSYINKEMK